MQIFAQAFSALLLLIPGILSQGTTTQDDVVLVDPRTRFSDDYVLPNQTFPGQQTDNWDPQIDSGETSYVGNGRLQGRRALITGGDSGIGRAIAIAFAREGASVAIGHLPEEQIDADTVRDLVLAENRTFAAIPGDIRNETFCTELVNSAYDALGGLDIVVNNAAYAQVQFSILNSTTETLTRTFETNVFAPFWITRAAVPLLPPGSSIIFTASALARSGAADMVDYAATKAALVSFTRSLTAQLLPEYGIRVNAVAPGLVWTNFLTSNGDTTENARSFGENVAPIGRAAQAAEMALTFVNIADGRNTYASGSVYGVTGGLNDF